MKLRKTPPKTRKEFLNYFNTFSAGDWSLSARLEETETKVEKLKFLNEKEIRITYRQTEEAETAIGKLIYGLLESGSPGDLSCAKMGIKSSCCCWANKESFVVFSSKHFDYEEEYITIHLIRKGDCLC